MNYFNPNMCLTLLKSASWTIPIFVNAFLRFLLFLVKIWLLNACFLLILPVPVSLKRFLALDFVFCFGMFFTFINYFALLYSSITTSIEGSFYIFSEGALYYFFFGEINIIIRLPSSFGICSTFPNSSKSRASRNSKISP